MKTVFIVNPVAGGRDISQELAKSISHTAYAIGLSPKDYLITRTTHPGHARELAERYASAGEPVRFFSAGGDGTFNEVLNGAWPYENASVGCLPYGSGNDFLRNFGAKEEFLDLANQLAGDVLPIDLYETPWGVGAMICAAGLDAKIAYDIPQFRRLPFCGGSMAYKLSILQNLKGPLSRKLSITLDGETITRDCILTAVCNGSYYGGGFHASPTASMQDGLLDVMVIRNMPLHRVIRALPLYQKGKHIQNGQVTPKLRDIIDFYRCRSVEISLADSHQETPIIATMDGECFPTQDLWVKILPMAGRVFLPASVMARLKQNS